MAHMVVLGHALMKNRIGLCFGATVPHANGFGEEDAGLELDEAGDGSRRIALGADKPYDTR